MSIFFENVQVFFFFFNLFLVQTAAKLLSCERVERPVSFPLKILGLLPKTKIRGCRKGIIKLIAIVHLSPTSAWLTTH